MGQTIRDLIGPGLARGANSPEGVIEGRVGLTEEARRRLDECLRGWKKAAKSELSIAVTLFSAKAMAEKNLDLLVRGLFDEIGGSRKKVGANVFDETDIAASGWRVAMRDSATLEKGAARLFEDSASGGTIGADAVLNRIAAVSEDPEKVEPYRPLFRKVALEAQDLAKRVIAVSQAGFVLGEDDGDVFEKVVGETLSSEGSLGENERRILQSSCFRRLKEYARRFPDHPSVQRLAALVLGLDPPDRSAERGGAVPGIRLRRRSALGVERAA